MTTSSKRLPELGKLYMRLMVPHKRHGVMTEELYAIIREKEASWRTLGEADIGMDPLFLWDIERPGDYTEHIVLHFLWRGRKVTSRIIEEEFSKWFGEWEHV